MAHKECCPHCGASLMKHSQNFSKALGGILLTLAYKFPEGQPFHAQRDIGLSKNQFNNMQKLRYFGLIKKVYTDGKRDGGFWCLTGLVKYVINGKAIPKVKWTFRNHVVESSEETITLEEAVGLYEIPSQWSNKAKPMQQLVQADLFTAQIPR
jgi:hypothetical protein